MTRALIAGSGALPKAVVEALKDRPLICSPRGHIPDDLEPDIIFRLEHLGTLLKTIQDRGITRVCFCGAVKRPSVDIAEIDANTMPLLPTLQRALQPGDDGALKAIIEVFELADLVVEGAHEIAPALLPPMGTLTAKPADEGVDTELEQARSVLKQMADIDEGQACVVRGSTVLAQEDPRGTDAMLADLAAPRAKPMPPADDPFNWIMDSVGEALDDTSDWLSGDAGEKAGKKGAGGVLFKGPKPGQDRRADLPTIGPETVRGAHSAGLRGIVLATDGVMVLDRARVTEMCDQAGLFLTIRDFS